MSYINQILEATPQGTTIVRPLTRHNKTHGTQLEKQVELFCGPPHMDLLLSADQQVLIYISSVWTQDVD